MKLRLTPLNILSATLLVASVYMLLFADTGVRQPAGPLSVAGLAALCFISDLVFRIYIKHIKRIWIVELAFMIFAAVLIFLIGRI